MSNNHALSDLHEDYFNTRILSHRGNACQFKMIRNTLLLGTALTLLIIFIDKSHSIDIRSLADHTSYRCSGGIVAVGDLDRDVREKCGDPLEIGRRQDFGPIGHLRERLSEGSPSAGKNQSQRRLPPPPPGRGRDGKFAGRPGLPPCGGLIPCGGRYRGGGAIPTRPP